MHIQAWREAYRGLMPDSVLQNLDPQKRAAMWRETLARGTSVGLACAGPDIVGFIACGPQRNATLPYPGEIYGLYVLARAQRQGIGRALMAIATTQLLAQGLHAATLWVLEGNAPARAFYTALGGEPCAERLESRDGWSLREIAYAWNPLTPPPAT